MKNIDQLEYQPVLITRGNLSLQKQSSFWGNLKNSSFLSNISEEAANALLEKGKIVTYPKNTIIISEGSAGNAFYIVLTGKVRVYASGYENDKEVTLLIQEAGSTFGEISLLTDEARSASVVALEKTVCKVISKDHFISWLIRYPNAAINVLGILSLKIKQLTDKVRQMALLNVYERIVNILKELAVDEGDISVIHNRPTQQDLASMVGASREMVGKIMHDLLKGGYIQQSANKSLIINKKLPVSW